MRAAVLILALALGACTQMPTPGGAPGAREAPQGAQQAYFEEYPERLFEAAAAVCTAPGQTVVQPNRDEVRCESLPDPESAAAIILQFDGTVQDLPTYVIRFLGRMTAQGYLVTADSYIRVPQRNGGTAQLRFPDPRVQTDLSSLLTSAGGRPL